MFVGNGARQHGPHAKSDPQVRRVHEAQQYGSGDRWGFEPGFDGAEATDVSATAVPDRQGRFDTRGSGAG